MSNDAAAVRLNWTDSPTHVRCRACGFEGEGRHVLDLSSPDVPDIGVDKCVRCGTLDLLAEPIDIPVTDQKVNSYLEAGAGLGRIAEMLTVVDPARTQRFADIGCGFGFSLALGKELFGWDVVGVEPGYSGERGRAEAGVNIVTGFFDADLDLGGNFDLILSSEVVEHIPEPLGFLIALRAQLAPGGIAVLTTPAAEVVEHDQDAGAAITALSPGYHCVLMSEQGMNVLLERAGFGFWSVERFGGTLIMAAGMSPLPALNFSGAINRRELEDWYVSSAEAITPHNHLSLGLWSRAFRSAVARGDFDKARAYLKPTVAALQSVYGIGFADVAASGVAAPRESDEVSWALPGVLFAFGMLQLISEGKPEAAQRAFEAALAAATHWNEASRFIDLDTADIIVQASYHRLLSAVLVDASRFAQVATAEAIDAFNPEQRCRLFVDVFVRGGDEAAAGLENAAAGVAHECARSDDATTRRAGLDALLTLGHAAQRRSLTEQADSWFRHAIDAVGMIPIGDDYALGLCDAATAALSGSPLNDDARHNAREFVRRVGRSLETYQGTRPDVVGYIDLFWRDSAGFFVEGWVHADDLVITHRELMADGLVVDVTDVERVDLVVHWPRISSTRLGFRVHVLAPMARHIQVRLSTTKGDLIWSSLLPSHQVPLPPVGVSYTGTALDIKKISASAPEGPALGIGLRSDDPDAADFYRAQFGEREVVGLDIHPGCGVDVVGDTHQLSTIFADKKFAVIRSESLVEHIAVPWLFALECNRVMVMGGILICQVPWVWPSHSEPNDFWRFSPEGLRLLFSPELGFEFVQGQGLGNVTVQPTGSMFPTYQSMPTTFSPAGSVIVVRKVAEPHPDASWPYDPAAGQALAEEYPVWGLGQKSSG